MALQEVKSSLKYLRIAPRKVRLVAELIKNKPVDVAAAILSVTNKKAALPLLKLLRSAVANAKHNFKLEANKLFVKSIRVDQGPMLKRWMPRARGAVNQIQKKTSHVWLVLGVKEEGEEKFAIFKEEKVKKEKKVKGEKKEERKVRLKKEEEKVKIKEEVEEKKGIFRRKAI